MNLGSAELLILALVVVVLFGASWLPKAARNFGRAKVELDKTQKQLTAAKDQVVEATGLDKAEATLRKANRALNQSPKAMIKGVATGSLAASGRESDTAAEGEPIEDAELVEVRAEDLDAAPAETVNVDWSLPEEQDDR